MKPHAPTPEQIIYLVDDDEALRDSLVWLLESQGFKVAAFPSAEDFLRRWRPEFNGCLLLDVRMPDMDGAAVAQRVLTALEATPTAQRDAWFLATLAECSLGLRDWSGIEGRVQGRLLRLGGRNGQNGSQGGRRQRGENLHTRPGRRGQDTEIHCGKPFLNGSARKPRWAPISSRRAAVSLSIEADA
mgnify:CR=1 FL=1